MSGQDNVPSTQVARHLANVMFPANKGEMLQHAHDEGANEDAMQIIRRLPNREYMSLAEVLRRIGQIG
jgi:hypothetical protein